MSMERKCKNCMCFHQASWHGDGSNGTCGATGPLKVHNREDACDCGGFVELPKREKVIRTIEKVLKPWIRERDAMFVRAMELVAHLGQWFENGEFKVFDAVKSASEMKGLVFFGKDTIHKIERIWTYHCPWDEDKEHFIAISGDGYLVTNTWDNFSGEFETSFIHIEDDFDICIYFIDRIHQNCVMKALVIPTWETEKNKCVSDESDWKQSAEEHPINKEDTIIRCSR